MQTNGKIYICATPIGNLGDVTHRLISVLKDADMIYAEDTRVTENLLRALNIKNKIYRLDQNIIDKHAIDVVKLAQAGKNIAYCSDAGTPAISDPGCALVHLAYKFNVDLEVLPGACAATTAFVYSGFATQGFYFGGFFPRKKTDIASIIDKVKLLKCALVFYESPKRIIKTLQIISDVLPNRQIAFCKELTKLHQDVIVDTADGLIKKLSPDYVLKGEIVLVIDKASNIEIEKDASQNVASAKQCLELLNPTNTSLFNIRDFLVKFCNISKNEAYKLALDWKQKPSAQHR